MSNKNKFYSSKELEEIFTFLKDYSALIRIKNISKNSEAEINFGKLSIFSLFEGEFIVSRLQNDEDVTSEEWNKIFITFDTNVFTAGNQNGKAICKEVPLIMNFRYNNDTISIIPDILSVNNISKDTNGKIKSLNFIIKINEGILLNCEALGNLG